MSTDSSQNQPDLACRRVVEMVTDYLEGALSADEQPRLEQHLLLCDACAVYVEQHRGLVHALSQLPACAPESNAQAPADGPPSRKAALDVFRQLRKPTPKPT